MRDKNIARPTLSWPGKTQDLCREVRDLHLIELHNEQDAGSETWRNLLVSADNLLFMSSLRDGPLRSHIEQQGGIRLIYCDPPFAVGSDFTMPAPLSHAGMEKRHKKNPLQMLAYSDQWPGGINGFLSMMYERLLLMRELLAPEGSIYLHCDWRTAPYLRLIMDEIFGQDRFLGDIVWHYTGGGRSKRWFSRKHDRILHYAASDTWYFNPDAVRIPYKKTSGYAKGGITSAAGKHYSPHPLGTPPDDVWDIPMINPLAKERCGYPTQKPESLLERIILASTKPGDLIADFFCGSGTTAICAQKLGRPWIAVDSGALAVHTARKRLRAKGASFAVALLDGSDQPYSRRQQNHDCIFDAHAQTAPTPVHTARLAGKTVRYSISDIRIKTRQEEEFLCVELESFTVSPVGNPEGANSPKIADEPENASIGAQNASPSSFKHASVAPSKKHPAAPSDTAFQKLMEGNWLDWLDFWYVGVSCGETAMPEGILVDRNCCCRVFGSSTGDAPMQIVLPKKETNWQPLWITIVDVFANESRFAVNV